MLCPPHVCLSVCLSDEEKENGEETGEETENNNVSKPAAPVKSKG